MGDLLRGARALGAVLRLAGRWRIASIIGSVVTIGWFVLNLGDRADAYAGPVTILDADQRTFILAVTYAVFAVLALGVIRLAVVGLRRDARSTVLRRDDGWSHGVSDAGGRHKRVLPAAPGGEVLRDVISNG